MISRRNFLGTAGLALATTLGRGARAAEGRLFAYVGRDPVFSGSNILAALQAPITGGGVDAFRVNMSDGSLQRIGSPGPEASNLSCDGMCTSADGRFLYVISNTTALDGVRGAGGGVAAFAIHRDDGTLRHLITRPSMGTSPVAVKIDKSHSRVIVANHGAVFKVTVVSNKNGVPVVESPTDSATVALFPVGSDGSLGSPLDAAVFSEPAPPGESDARAHGGAACHSVAFDRTQRWIIATDNGYDHIYIYRFSPAARKLVGKAYPTAPGTAPRHIAVHPSAPYFFITNEREPTVSAFHFDSDTGVPRLMQTIATVPAGAPPAAGTPGVPGGSPDDIRLHPNGKFLYASTRLGAIMEGQVGMTIFAIDASNGRLTTVDFLEAAGKGQREFNIEPSGKFLFGCNIQSNDVVTYALDPDTGKMTLTARTGDIPAAGVIDFAVL